jgi:hypothetical protein
MWFGNLRGEDANFAQAGRSFLWVVAETTNCIVYGSPVRRSLFGMDRYDALPIEVMASE